MNRYFILLILILAISAEVTTFKRETKEVKKDGQNVRKLEQENSTPKNQQLNSESRNLDNITPNSATFSTTHSFINPYMNPFMLGAANSMMYNPYMMGMMGGMGMGMMGMYNPYFMNPMMLGMMSMHPFMNPFMMAGMYPYSNFSNVVHHVSDDDDRKLKKD